MSNDSSDKHLGCKCVRNMVHINETLNERVVEQINDSQELCMLTAFAQESNEYQLGKCFETRISEIAAWRWVLEDLTKRLTESIDALRHEHSVIRVVIERLQKEINQHSRNASLPGVLKPYTDYVEDAILKEYKSLKDQKNNFEEMILEVEKQISFVEKTKKRIEDDLLKKENTIDIEESCMKNEFKGEGRTKRKKTSLLERWRARCECLKAAGLHAFSSALCAREQLRYARVSLSITAQAEAARVDSALRRRLHVNEIKLEELNWQQIEAKNDLGHLDNEQITAEKAILEIIEQIGVIEARIAERNLRPSGEAIRDDVSRRLKEEIARLRRSTKDMNDNIGRIQSLQINLNRTIEKINGCMEDLVEIINLDKKRIESRQNGSNSGTAVASSASSVEQATSSGNSVRNPSSEVLTTIFEDNEDGGGDEYPIPN